MRSLQRGEFGHGSRWLIQKRFGCWTLYAPTGTFWGRGGIFDTYDEAREGFIRQTRGLV